MKRVARITALLLGALLLFSSVALLSGCASVSAEDRNFFYRGWLFPNRDKLPAVE